MKQESLSGFNSIRSTEIRKGVGGIILNPGDPKTMPFRMCLEDMEEIHKDRIVDATLFGDKEQHWMSLSSGHEIICPDLFGTRHLGSADNYRGHLVRAFAALLDYVWPAGK